MTDKHQMPSGSSISLADIYHALFRHKKKILVIWAIGIVAGAIVWFTQPVKFQSRAQLLIRYVTDTRSITSGADDSIQTPNARGSSVISSEMAILQSFDLARQVAEAIGPARVLARINGGSEVNSAAGVIRGGLTVDSPRGSALIKLTFEHPDPQLVRPVLDEIIRAYLNRHAEVHLAAGTLDEVLTRQTDQLRTELQQTEQELRAAKSKIGVISLEDSKRACAEQIAKIRESLFAAEADLKARRTALQLTNLTPVGVSTNVVAVSTNMTTPPEKLSEYNRISGLLTNLRKVEQDRLLQYQPGSPRVVEVQRLIATNEVAMRALEQEFPQLLTTPAAMKAPTDDSFGSRQDTWSQMTQIRQLESKIEVLNEQLALVRQEAATLSETEGAIAELQRKRDLLERNYTHFSASLNNARFDENLGTGRVSNISTVESPTPPGRSLTKTAQIVAGLVIGSLVLGIALAFGIELYFDRSVRRPIDIEQRLRVPLFLSIPFSGTNRNAKRLSAPPGINGNGAAAGVPAAKSSWNQDETLRTYYETLRDRLLLYFEANNLTHKPKLVAVTGCAPGSGVSTIASGLAATLSETGDGNVLLVDMNELERGAAAHFRRGKLEYGLDDVLEGNPKRENAMVQDNLYVVAETSDDRNLPRILHKRFATLMPKLRASDYDYIIFDMPAVSQISPTSRLAKFMDMVFLVVESEKTDRDVVKRAADMLTQSKANVGVLLNKSRTYIPKALQQDL